MARLTGPVRREAPIFVDACRFARAHTTQPLKVTLPGPMTVADSVADEAGDADFKTLAMRFAEILNREARDLVDAGADVIQFDEPCFNIYLDEVAAWGIETLEQAMDGVRARKAVHICYGYGTPTVLAWKSANTDWGHYGVTLPLLARSRVDQVSVECAASGVDVAVLGELRGKDVLLGVVDVGTEDVETPEVVAARIRQRAAVRRARAAEAVHRLRPGAAHAGRPRSARCGRWPRARRSWRASSLGRARRGDDLNGAGRAARKIGIRRKDAICRAVSNYAARACLDTLSRTSI